MNISRDTAWTLIELLEGLLEYMDQRADADTLLDGTFLPNNEMTFATNIKEAITFLTTELVEEEVGSPDDPS